MVSDELHADEEPRDVIDRYRLTRLHSEGGLGRVWLANDPSVGRDVALKELLADQAADPAARARFLGEACITGQLEHPNIVPVYDVGEREGDDRPFYTMRFVRGPTLKDVILEDVADADGGQSSRLRRRKLLRALCSIGNAISHAHSRGIVHRDLKPENVILGPHGELILLDWGLAKRIQAEDSESDVEQQPTLLQTNAGSVMGTIAYMSPEQANGHPPDERTDIYGLGAILFEILTGRPPHVGGDAVDVLRQIIEADTVRARSVQPSAPAPLDAICAKAMAKLPMDRYPSAEEFVKELECWLNDEPIKALPDTPPARVARWIRRHQGLAIAVATAILLVSIVATTAAVRLGAAADREHGLREGSIQVAARLAAIALGSEIEVRWLELQSAARNDSVRRWLASGDRKNLQEWIQVQFDLQKASTGAVSWIIQDAQGIQHARAPQGTSIGKNYAFRDYFHGGGKDLDEGTVGVTPIRQPHLSAVFKSQVTENRMVAFTVPVWDRDDEESRKVIGVLGMTVELGLGLFRCLKGLGLDDNQVAVLVDTQEDWNQQPGLVMQHPELVRQRKQMEAAKQTGLATEDLQLAHIPRQLVSQFVEHGHGVLRNYHDAVGGDYEGRWLAAYETVTVWRFGSGNTSWVVIIQERDTGRAK